MKKKLNEYCEFAIWGTIDILSFVVVVGKHGWEINWKWRGETYLKCDVDYKNCIKKKLTKI